mmetsp:Transcript_331/g.808  ORF Transcript_331/g.808 Transcript_331/m.808 type:complete len:452 (+) Transcript_331:43-1398(+)
MLCWVLLLSPSTVASRLPSIAWRGLVLSAGMDDNANTTMVSPLQRQLPPVPMTRSAAFALGELAAKVRILYDEVPGTAWPGSLSAQDQRRVTDILVEAATFVDRPGNQLSIQELVGIGVQLSDLDKHRGVIARVVGAFTFINMIWLLSIAGIAISIGPSLVHVLQPLREILIKVARWLCEHVVEPIAMRCHTWGVFEALAWTFMAAILSDATFVFHPATGSFVAMTSSALSLGPAFGYSFLVWATRLEWPAKHENNEALLQVVAWWGCVTLAPLALAFNSQLLAYFATFAAYTALGFGVACRGLCWFIGFSSHRAMERVFATSTLLLGLHLFINENAKRELPFFLGNVANTNGLPLWATRESPFGAPVAVVGSLTLYLALLICSSLYYTDNRSSTVGSSGITQYAAKNSVMALALGIGVALGAVCGTPGLTNTATTFLALWLFGEKTKLHL